MTKEKGLSRKSLKAAAICERYEPDEEARQHLTGDVTAKEYFLQLRAKGLFKEAVRFLAHALPQQEAVWWGLLCVWQISRPEPHPEAEAAVKAAVQWVQDPSEENRLAAGEAGKLVQDDPAGRVAMAAFWSGGSMAPGNLPKVKPPPTLTSQTVASAILVAANSGDPSKRAVRYQEFLQWGITVASGANRW